MSNLFDSLNMREFNLPGSDELRRFIAKEYGTGRPCLAIEARVDEGSGVWWEPDIVVTVNLPELPLPPDGFFVRRHGFESYIDQLFETGLFEDMGVDIPAGYVEKYARVWRLKPPPKNPDLN